MGGEEAQAGRRGEEECLGGVWRKSWRLSFGVVIEGILSIVDHFQALSIEIGRRGEYSPRHDDSLPQISTNAPFINIYTFPI